MEYSCYPLLLDGETMLDMKILHHLTTNANCFSVHTISEIHVVFLSLPLLLGNRYIFTLFVPLYRFLFNSSLYSTVTQTAGMALWGRFSDIFGRRLCLLVSLGAFVVGSIACALSESIEQLVIFRAVQGIGGGGIMTCVMIVVSDLTPPSSRAAYIAPLASAFALSSVCGPLIGGALTDSSVGWRMAFWINLPIGVPCFIIQWYFIPKSLGQRHLMAAEEASKAAPETNAASATVGESTATTTPANPEFAMTNPMQKATTGSSTETNTDSKDQKATTKHHHHKRPKIDYLGSITIVIAVTCLALALVWGGAEYPWDDGRIIALLIIAIIFIIVFIVIEWKFAEDPIIPLRLFTYWNFTVSSLITFFSGAAMACFYIFLPLFFQYALLESASESGVSMIPMMLGLPVGAIATGILVTKTGSYRFYPILGCIGLIVASYLYVTMDVTLTTANKVGFLILGGLAMGPNVQVPLLAGQNAVPSKDMAVASSTINFFQSVSGLLSTSIAQTILNSRAITLMTPIYNDLLAILPPNTPMDSKNFDIKMLKGTPLEPFFHRIVDAYATATTSIFWVSLICGVLGLAAALFMKHIPLRDGITPDAVHVEGVPPPPMDDDSSDNEDDSTEPKKVEDTKSSPKSVVVKVAPEVVTDVLPPKVEETTTQ